ncbi:uncharacterized protein TRUGW13939_00016 [Talaromyces rugulosus]|uniref:Methyltransferase n=1 Tax=Talaromyces rugulosus TaxID=121627 RepID=A0A7H8QHL7_TALRU|nr:uncharacterized protein TRUGW13939_00016 [Talaromyces rugulosus]QKX52945.1 hypothetical protein TRUGW13939_00016 [Talaromyces rugulosus]
MFRRVVQPSPKLWVPWTPVSRAYIHKVAQLQSVAQQTVSPVAEAGAGEFSKQKPFDHVPWKEPVSTTGTVRFFGKTTDNKAHTLNFKKGEELQSNLGKGEELDVKITDLRTYEPPVSLSLEGVEWVQHPTVLTEEKLLDANKAESDAFVRSHYFDECAALVKEKSGAATAIAYNYRHRRIETGTNLFDPLNFSNKPLSTMHMDNDAKTAEVNLRRVLGDAEAERWLSKHWGIINVWRPVGVTVHQWPLALVDSTTFSRGDGATTPIYTKNNYKSHFTGLTFNPEYKFYYVSNLGTDEALLFVDFDSEPKGNLIGMAHGAFEDHNGPADAPLRRSIEVRCLVLYDD